MPKSSAPPTGVHIPLPPHPHRRREPLPWHQPKPAEDDADAPRRLQAILQSPSYCEADEDIDFLNLDATRGVRLQIDYFKPELLLTEHGITQTVVVFGSTRILEPSAARRAVETLKRDVAASPGNEELHQRLRPR